MGGRVDLASAYEAEDAPGKLTLPCEPPLARKGSIPRGPKATRCAPPTEFRRLSGLMNDLKHRKANRKASEPKRFVVVHVDTPRSRSSSESPKGARQDPYPKRNTKTD